VGGGNMIFSSLTKLIHDSAHQISNEKEQIKMITMKELTEMPMDQMRNLYN
jgi:hypothetical protein